MRAICIKKGVLLIHHSKLLIITLLLFMFSFPLLTDSSTAFIQDNPEAESGILDLTGWELEEEITDLDGQWEFYWNRLLEPQELRESGTSKDGYIELPSSWNKFRINDSELSGNGYATYRLFFTVEDSDRLGIKIPRIFTAYKLWVNDELIATAGLVGKSRETTIPQYLPKVALFESRVGDNEVVIQVSNFHHRSGGILEGLIIGHEEQIIRQRYILLAFEILMFGGITIIGVYHLVLFLSRKKYAPPLYFGLFCMFIGVRTLLVGENFFIYLFPDFNWEIAHKVQTLTFYLGVPLILLYFRSVFPHGFHPRIVKLIVGVGIAFGGLTLLTPARFFTIFNPIYQFFTILVIVYLLSSFIKLIARKEKGMGLIFVGAIVLIITSVNDIVFTSVWMNDQGSDLLRTMFRLDNLSSVGQLFFVFINSIVLARNFSSALDHEEEMSLRLKEINLNLDQLVIQRTEALEASRKKIESQKNELEKTNVVLQLNSLKDPLTNLWNRRQYNDTLQMDWRRSLRYKRPISLLIIDIDYFKKYNDYYGHKAGDECLVKVAQAINDSFMRVNDLAARYGGEEFVVILSELEKDDAIKVARLLQMKIENLNIPHERSPVSPWITVSIGVASRVPDLDCSADDLFMTADKALYQAKAAGRNQVKYLWE